MPDDRSAQDATDQAWLAAKRALLALASTTSDAFSLSTTGLLESATSASLHLAGSAGDLLDALLSSFPASPLAALRATEAVAAWLRSVRAPEARSAFLTAGWMRGLRREPAEATSCAALAVSSAEAPCKFPAWISPFLVQGLAALATGDHTAAFLALRAAQSDPVGASGEAEVALALAHLHIERGELDSAREQLAAAASLAGALPWLSFRVRCEEADLLFYGSNYARAESVYDELDDIARSDRWPLEQAHILVMRGLAAGQRGDITPAESRLLAAKDIYAGEETPYYLGVCQRALGTLYRKAGRYGEALAAATEALTHFQRSGHPVAAGRCQHAIGLIDYDWNRYAEALVAYQAAFDAYGAAGLRREQSAIRVNIALIHEAQGHYDAAYSSYEQAATEYQALRVPGDVAICLSNMAGVRQRLGQHAGALQLYQRSRRVLVRTGSRFDAAIVALGQSASLQALGKSDSARRLLLRCRRFFAAERSPGQLALCEMALGEDSVLRGQTQRAVVHFQRARDLLSDAGQVIDVAFADLLIGEALLAAGLPGAARDRFEDASRLLAGGFPDMAARAEVGLGRASAATGDASSAARHWQAAVDDLARVRRQLVTEDHGAGFFSVWRWVYEAALEGWMVVRQTDRVLGVIEAAKGQVLASMLEQQDLIDGLLAGEDPSVSALWERSREIASRLTAARPTWYAPGQRDAPSHLALSDAASGSTGNAPQRQLSALLDEQELLFERVRRLRASFDLIAPATQFDLDQFRETAVRRLGAGWSALVYYLRDQRLVTLWLTADRLESWQQELTTFDVHRIAQLCDPNPERRELTYGGTLHGVAQPAAPGDRLLRRAAKMLIPDEVWETLAPDRALLMIPHGILHSLPFHALLADDGSRLLHRAMISYAPTLQVWQTLALRRHSLPDRERRALIVGIQDFGARAPALQYALEEARVVSGILGAGAQVMLGAEARRDTLLDLSSSGELERQSILHLATHAVFDADHPLTSRLILSDGALSVPELFRLRLDADLLVLSGCETALSTVSPGDELLGLREALLVAGARSLVLSLWPVDDASTARLMRSFYSHLLGDQNDTLIAHRPQPGLQIASALAAAQREMAIAGESAYHWAPFVSVG